MFSNDVILLNIYRWRGARIFMVDFAPLVLILPAPPFPNTEHLTICYVFRSRSTAP